MAYSSGTAELLKCSICLDQLREPRMLPCQHTFCLNCLLGVVDAMNTAAEEDEEPRPRDAASLIRCPQCRGLYRLSTNGVRALPPNRLINNLLSLPPPAARCQDCSGEGPVSSCGHCRQLLCVNCCVEHARLEQIVRQTLVRIRSALTPPGGSTEQLETSLRAVELEKERMDAAVQEQANLVIQALENRHTQMAGIFQTLIDVHQDLLKPAGERKPFLENLFRQTAEKKSKESLHRHQNLLEQVQTFVKLVRRRADVQFASEPLNLDLQNWGRVKLGDKDLKADGLVDSLTLINTHRMEPSNSSCPEEEPQLPAARGKKKRIFNFFKRPRARSATEQSISEEATSSRSASLPVGQTAPTRSAGARPPTFHLPTPDARAAPLSRYLSLPSDLPNLCPGYLVFLA